ncbi:hypothetical protein VTK73DRAFT_8339 [Phialemonium thermophilum]|uniref:N-acetyltransferase domain-containing protein n=1 Tax=Phialemonium thermophilum TaxID=223376 RepID=A0ABR3Y6X2_9PEZI
MSGRDLQLSSSTTTSSDRSEGATNADAVDESDDAGSNFVAHRRQLSLRKWAAKDSTNSLIQKEFPFTFSPNVQLLSVSDLDSVVALENAAFQNPEYRASAEKLEYRLATCPELSLGIFCTVYPGKIDKWEIETLATAQPVETGREDGAVRVLLAHIVSTRAYGDVVADEDMDYPKDWRNLRGKSVAVGNQDFGRTVALHSLAVSPKMQGYGLGTMIIKSYLERINNTGAADRVALLCQDYLVGYYERIGFQHKGESKATFGGGGWHNMVIELPGQSKAPF